MRRPSNGLSIMKSREDYRCGRCIDGFTAGARAQANFERISSPNRQSVFCVCTSQGLHEDFPSRQLLRRDCRSQWLAVANDHVRRPREQPRHRRPKTRRRIPSASWRKASPAIRRSSTAAVTASFGRNLYPPATP